MESGDAARAGVGLVPRSPTHPRLPGAAEVAPGDTRRNETPHNGPGGSRSPQRRAGPAPSPPAPRARQRGASLPSHPMLTGPPAVAAGASACPAAPEDRSRAGPRCRRTAPTYHGARPHVTGTAARSQLRRTAPDFRRPEGAAMFPEVTVAPRGHTCAQARGRGGSARAARVIAPFSPPPIPANLSPLQTCEQPPAPF